MFDLNVYFVSIIWTCLLNPVTGVCGGGDLRFSIFNYNNEN